MSVDCFIVNYYILISVKKITNKILSAEDFAEDMGSQAVDTKITKRGQGKTARELLFLCVTSLSDAP